MRVTLGRLRLLDVETWQTAMLPLRLCYLLDQAAKKTSRQRNTPEPGTSCCSQTGPKHCLLGWARRRSERIVVRPHIRFQRCKRDRPFASCTNRRCVRRVGEHARHQIICLVVIRRLPSLHVREGHWKLGKEESWNGDQSLARATRSQKCGRELLECGAWAGSVASLARDITATSISPPPVTCKIASLAARQPRKTCQDLRQRMRMLARGRFRRTPAWWSVLPMLPRGGLHRRLSLRPARQGG
ncbi:hypothetical protein QBC34DRAFT_72236 [Podospora aff. communis PSN243]|uniref:Uncharacterized protein n=1 Tax=Podospora aff. communis PSN243 TaxID=3040156 RepID=A0AAV9H998_9PEZI|nr:hypothetical protein QBC34DRAFT_72236 [Podospora aff. communis PSN243]